VEGDRGRETGRKEGGRCTGRREKRGGGESGIPKVAGSRRKRKKIAIEKMQRGGSQQIKYREGTGIKGYGETGGLNSPIPPLK